jgi:hypothetical protein
MLICYLFLRRHSRLSLAAYDQGLALVDLCYEFILLRKWIFVNSNLVDQGSLVTCEVSIYTSHNRAHTGMRGNKHAVRHAYCYRLAFIFNLSD